MNHFRFFSLVVLAVLTAGCIVRKAQIVSPYQQALSAYYKALETADPADLLAAEKAATLILDKDASDHTARILRANNTLTWLRQNQDTTDQAEWQKKRGEFIKDLRTLFAGIGTIGETVDWVPARALVSMGDLLVLEGNARQKVGVTETNAAKKEQRFVEAKALFDAARHFYRGAAGLADQKVTTSTPGLAREAAHARNGHLATIRGVLNVLRNLDSKLTLPQVATIHMELLQAWEAQSIAGTLTTVSIPVLSFDAAEQESMLALYRALRIGTQNQLQTWCTDHKGLPQKNQAMLTPAEKAAMTAGNALFRRVVSQSEFGALHASVAQVLSKDRGDISGDIADALLWLKRDWTQQCPP